MVSVEVRVSPMEPVPEDGERVMETVARKLADTEEGVLTVSDVGLAVPESAPPHAWNAYPDDAVSVKDTEVPWGTYSVWVAPAATDPDVVPKE